MCGNVFTKLGCKADDGSSRTGQVAPNQNRELKIQIFWSYFYGFEYDMVPSGAETLPVGSQWFIQICGEAVLNQVCKNNDDMRGGISQSDNKFTFLI